MFIPRQTKKERKIIFITGAGLDAPSGIQTFRGTNGIWNGHDIKTVCDETTWKQNYTQVHQFYNERRVELGKAQPNIAHKKIKEITDKYGKDNVFNITQNVDDLFERVGTETLHVHGDLTKMECEACGENWDIGYNSFDIKEDRCPKCNSLKSVRPKIVFFYGRAPMYSYMFRAADYTMNPDTIMLVVGTMGNVINVDDIFLMGTPCYKILVDVKLPPDIKKENLDKIILTGSEEGMLEVEKIIAERWD
ncbi:MAG: Sir2 family NAD-dependent protein deacetylase [Bacteroidota bacterium]|nr:Sir2 family NAD-dependent protein deacetylase [Bacteroidota bacterium]